MLRPIRRALRQWRQEFSAFWGRFNTFRRMAIGILLAMTMIYGGRRWLLDKRVKEVKKLTNELAAKGVPDIVPDRTADEEVQNAELKAENLKASLADWSDKVKQAKDRWPRSQTPSAIDTVTQLDRILNRHGLVVHRRTEDPDQEDCPIPCTCHRYETAGSYQGILGFLQEVSLLQALCTCDAIQIAAPVTEQADTAKAGRAGALRLSFRFTVMRP